MKSLSNTILGAALAMGIGISSSAHATLVMPGNETPLQTVINSLYQSTACPLCSPVTDAPNVNLNQYGPDERWTVEASGLTAATIVIELAGNKATNTFGVYDVVNHKQVQLFAGAADQTDQATISFGLDGSVTVVYLQRNATGFTTGGSINPYDAGYFSGTGVFGFYLGTVGGTFYSEAGRNAGGADQMVAFQGDGDNIAVPGNPLNRPWGSSSFILAWEDLPYATSDKDFNDFVVYVESVRGVPEPGSLALLGLALVGIGAMRRRIA